MFDSDSLVSRLRDIETNRLATFLARAQDAYRAARSVAQHPLHRGQRLPALLRWMRLRLASEFVPTHQITIPYVGGAVLTWPKFAGTIALCARYGLSEYEDMAFCLHLLRKGDLFCDVGANAGIYTVLAARAIGCSVVAVEPVPLTFDVLMQNVHANNISDRVDARRIGVGKTPSTLRFTTELWGYNHVVNGSGDNTVAVEVQPLDTVLAERVPTMLKIDVEGFEAEALAGAKDTIRNPGVQAVLIEMCAEHLARYGATVDNLHRTLIAAGFSGPHWYDPATRTLIEPGLLGFTKHNHLFVRDYDFITERLNTSNRYEINGVHV